MALVRDFSGGLHLTDAEWALIEPLMPAPNRIGRPRKTDDHVPGSGVASAIAVLCGRGREWISLPQRAG